jgi:hypothetical protein
VVETCSVTDPDEWWIRNQTRFWSSCKTDHRYFQPKLIDNVNYPWIPNEDEDFRENEMGVGHRTDDDFEGEETCQDSREEDTDDGE